MEKVNKRAVAIAIAVFVLLCAWLYYRSTAWERDFTLKYLGSEYLGEERGSKYFYEITNNTNKEFSDVKIVFRHHAAQKLNYEHHVGSLLSGQTKEFTITDVEIQEETDSDFVDFYDYKIKRIKYR